MASEISSTLENCLSTNEEFIPSAEELETLYVLLESGVIPELQWQCPGKRTPSPDSTANRKEQETHVDSAEPQEPTKNDFDFSDDIPQPQMRVRSQNSTPKSAKKKTANFAGVMEVLKKKNAESST